MRRSALSLLLLLALLAGACGPGPGPVGPAHDGSTRAADPLDERPRLGPPKPYRAPAPVVYTTDQGLTVWLVERHQLPVVSICLALPHGSADDPPDKPGLAHVTASMLDEGAGSRGALEISSALTELGAAFYAAVSADGSRMRLTVLRRHFEAAFDVLADIVSAPHFAPTEWSRVSELWTNQLRERVDYPGAVAGLVGQAVLYGPDSPYGHPTSGQLAATKAVTLSDIRAFYERHWRPDRALLVAVGDLSRAELDGMLTRSLARWTRPATPPPPPIPPPKPQPKRPRLVVVDRPSGPQAVIVAVRPGVAANDSAAPLLQLLNTVLGGSFTSRLNQNLREKRGWSYGAGSTFVQSRGVGPFVAQAAVQPRYLAPAVRELLAEIERMRTGGLSEDEYVKTRAQDLTGLIETHQTVDHLAWRLAKLGVLGLPPRFDADSSRARQQVSRAELTRLAGAHLDTSDATIVLVGPAASMAQQMTALGLGKAEPWGPDGRPLSAP